MTEDEKRLEHLYKRLNEKGILEKAKKIHEKLHKTQGRFFG